MMRFYPDTLSGTPQEDNRLDTHAHSTTYPSSADGDFDHWVKVAIPLYIMKKYHLGIDSETK